MQEGKVGGFYEDVPCCCSPPEAGGAANLARRRWDTKEVGRLIVIAANMSAMKNPDWYYYRLAQPQVMVEIGQKTCSASATIVEGGSGSGTCLEDERLGTR